MAELDVPVSEFPIDDGVLDAVALTELEDQITSYAGRLAAAMARWLVWIAAFDRREGWGRWEQRSCAAWLNWKCGVSLRTAHEYVRVARSLEELPILRRMFLAGEISYSKARAISRVANEHNEDELCELAMAMTAAQLDATCGRLRPGADAEPWTPTISFHKEGDHGRIVIDLPADDMTRARDAVFAIADELIAEHHQSAPDGQTKRETVDDMGGLGVVRTYAAAAILDGSIDSVDGPFEDAMLVVDTDTLASESAEYPEKSDGTCTLGDEWIPPIVARRIACDSRLQLAVENAVAEAIGLGREERVVNRRLRRLLRKRDHGMCRFPGCSTRRRLHAHHVIHWVFGGETELDNLILLCHFHHESVHEGGWNIINKNGHYAFYDPTGRETRVPRLTADDWPGDLPAPKPLRRRPEPHAPLAGIGETTDIAWIVENITHNTRNRRSRTQARAEAQRGRAVSLSRATPPRRDMSTAAPPPSR